MDKKKMEQLTNPKPKDFVEIARLASQVILKRDKKLLKELAKH